MLKEQIQYLSNKIEESKELVAGYEEQMKEEKNKLRMLEKAKENLEKLEGQLGE